MIRTAALTKRYGSTLAVDDLTFEVLPGRVTGFLGPNGAGKSTTMRLIMALDHPTSGHVSVNGRRYEDFAWPLREVGALLEAKSVHPGRSAYMHLLALAQTNDIAPPRVEEVLDLVGLRAVARRRAGKFSLGMGQRLGIAAALLGDPGVLLFDEPVNGLDPEGIVWVRTLLKKLAGEGRTVLVSSHLMSEMALTADHVVVIGKGRLIAEQSVDDLISRGTGRLVRVRTPSPAVLASVLTESGAHVHSASDGALEVTGMGAAQVGDLAFANNVALHELAHETGTLEEAFMELTRESVEFRAGSEGQAGVDDSGGERVA